MAGLTALYMIVVIRADRVMDKTSPSKGLVGSFSSTNEQLGIWTLSPTACISGRERGFQGIAFDFPMGGPIEEVRIDVARKGDHVVEVRLADRHGTVYRVRERECETIAGSVDQQHIDVAGRQMVRLRGHTKFACPSQGLKGEATFDGCLPENR